MTRAIERSDRQVRTHIVASEQMRLREDAERRRILLARQLYQFVDLDTLARELSVQIDPDRIAVEIFDPSGSGDGDRSGPDDLIVIAGDRRWSGLAEISSTDAPVLAVSNAWVEGRLRLDVLRAGTCCGPKDVRALPSVALSRAEADHVLSCTRRRRATMDAIDRTMVGLAPRAIEDAPLGSGAAALSPDRIRDTVAALGLASVVVPDDPPSVPSLVIVRGDDPLAELALEAGAVVIVLGASAATRSGVAVPVGDVADLEAVLRSWADGLLAPAARDEVRRHLATEILFGTVAATPGALATRLSAAFRGLAARAPSVSVVINNYNYGHFLGEAIDSVRRQTVQPLEIIVVDDGSTDHSRELLESCGDVVTVLKPNGGQASAFNAGFARARGDVILFLDADDRLKADCVETVLAAWEPGVSRVQFGLELIDRDGRPFGLYDTSRTALDGFVLGPLFASGFIPFMPTSGNAFSRGALSRILPMPEAEWRICADLYLALASSVVGRVVRMDEVLGDYRTHGANAYFDPHNVEHFTFRKKLPYHLAAWDHLADALPRLSGGTAPPLWKILLLRHALFWTGELGEGVRPLLRRAARAFRAVAMARGVPLSLKKRLVADLVSAASTGLRPSKLQFEAVTPPLQLTAAEGADPVVAGGNARWPVLTHGSVVNLRQPEEARSLLGQRWSTTSEGAVLHGETGALCFNLAAEASDWVARIGVVSRPSGRNPHVVARVNGRFMARLRSSDVEEWELFLPAHLLPTGRERPCFLEFSVRGGGPPVVLTKLEILAAPTQRRPLAPLLQPDTLLRIGPDAGAVVLAGGWRWPTDSGAVLDSPDAALAWSTPIQGPTAVRLEFAEPLGPDELAVTVAGEPVETVLSRDGRFLTALLAAWMVDPGGVVRIDVRTSNAVRRVDGSVQLLSIRHGGARMAAPLVLDRHYAIEPTEPASGIETRHIVPAGIGGRVGRHSSLVFRRPEVPGNLRVLLFLVPDGTLASTSVTIRLETSVFRVRLGTVNLVPLPVEERAGTTVRIELDAEDGAILGWIALEAATSARGGRAAVLAEGTTLGADDLVGAVVHTPDWHSPVGGVLWLAGAHGALALDVAADCAGLVVTVLLLEGDGHELRLSVDGSEVRVDRAGPSQAMIPLGPRPGGGRRRVVLEVSSNGLVALDALVSASEPAMIGGGILSVEALAVGDDDVRGPEEQLWTALVDRIQAIPTQGPVRQADVEALAGLRDQVAAALETVSETALDRIRRLPGFVGKLATLGAVAPRAPGAKDRAAPTVGHHSGRRAALLDLLRTPAFESVFFADGSFTPLVRDDPKALAAYLVRDPAGPIDNAATGRLVASTTALLRWCAERLGDREALPTDRQLAATVVRSWHSKRVLFGDQPLAGLMKAKAEAIEALLRSEGHDLDGDFSPRDGGRRLRVGVLVRAVEANPEGWAVLGMYTGLDRSTFEPILLTLGPAEGVEVGAVFERQVTLDGADTAGSVRAIRALDLDLFLLGAYSPSLDPVSAIVAHRLARVQILPTAVCPSTLGFGSFDVALSCKASEPKDLDGQYVEALRWIDTDAQCCYRFGDLQAVAPDARDRVRAALGVDDTTPVFVSGAMAHKILPDLMEAWIRVLASVDDSRLVLYPFARNWWIRFDEDRLRAWIDGLMRASGLDPGRVVILPPISPVEVREQLAAADVYLDSFPYSGATTVCEALSLGLPVVSLAGSSLRGLTGASWVRAYGVPELVATCEAGYVATAASLGGDADRRRGIRRRLLRHGREGRPPHDDPDRFGRAFSAALRHIAGEAQLVRADPDDGAPSVRPAPASWTFPGRRRSASSGPAALRRVLVVTSERSGSTLLCNVLNEAPGARMDYELFAAGEIQYRSGVITDPVALAARDRDPVGFLTDYFDAAASAGLALAGFKLFEYQNRSVLDHLASDKDLSLIILNRSNTLAKYASLRIAQTTNLWASTKEGGSRHQIAFDPDDFGRYVENVNAQRARLLEIVARHACTSLVVEYASLVSLSALPALSTFIGLPLPARLPTATFRQNPPDILDRFTNPASVRGYLRSIDRCDWLVEDA